MIDQEDFVVTFKDRQQVVADMENIAWGLPKDWHVTNRTAKPLFVLLKAECDYDTESVTRSDREIRYMWTPRWGRIDREWVRYTYLSVSKWVDGHFRLDTYKVARTMRHQDLFDADTEDLISYELLHKRLHLLIEDNTEG